MRALMLACICVVALLSATHAKNTYTVLSLGVASPMNSATHTPSGDKLLKTGWDGGFTFFGLPFEKNENALSGLGLGLKLNYSRWMRDSTWKELTFLGTQAIVRYYLPVKPAECEFFGQIGGGMFIGEHGYSDPDTLDRSILPPSPVIFKGIKNFGFTANIGIDWRFLEFTPGMTVVFTKPYPSTWITFSLAAKF
jgi:hypothetical protein